MVLITLNMSEDSFTR